MQVKLLHPQNWTMGVDVIKGLGTVRLSAKSPTNLDYDMLDYDMLPRDAIRLAHALLKAALEADAADRGELRWRSQSTNK